jgi:hypothetical protein
MSGGYSYIFGSHTGTLYKNSPKGGATKELNLTLARGGG